MVFFHTLGDIDHVNDIVLVQKVVFGEICMHQIAINQHSSQKVDNLNVCVVDFLSGQFAVSQSYEKLNFDLNSSSYLGQLWILFR
jgi:predicted RNA-binding protein with EMAP domain